MPATLEEIMNGGEAFRDVAVAAWRDLEVRVARLDGPEKQRISGLAADLPKDEAGNVSDKNAAYQFGVELLAASIVGDNGNPVFGTDAATRWLSGEIAAVAQLTPVAIEINGLGPSEIEKKEND